MLNGRFTTLWEPLDTFRAQLTLGGYQDKSDTIAGQAIAISPSVPAAAPLVPGLLTAPLAPADSRAADFTVGEDYARDNWFDDANLRLDADLNDNLTVTSLTSYSEYSEDRLVDTDGTSLRNLDVATTGSIESFSQELRLAGGIGTIGDFVVGVNYTNDEVLETEVLRNPESTIAFTFVPFGLPLFTSTQDINNQDSESYAIFGNVNVDVTPEWTVYGGVRYTDMSIDHEGCSADAGDGNTAVSFTVLLDLFRAGAGLPPITPIEPGGCFTADATLTPTFVQDELNEDNVSWRAGLDWTPNSDMLFYANVSKGFKAGSFPTLAASTTEQLAPVTQESLLAYEAGFKTQILDGTMQFNGAIFRYDYTDKQILGSFIDPVFGRLLRLVNIPDSRINGAELDVLWAPLDGLTITAGGSYIDSKIKGTFELFDAFFVLQDFGGESFPNTPELQLVSDIDYQFGLGNQLNGFVGGGVTYLGSTNSQLGQNPLLDVRDRTLIDLRAGVESLDGMWRVSLWGRNIGDTYYWEST
ncbi:MAG: TonB-dependent receptor, partial [Pseudomonadota bacterium]